MTFVQLEFLTFLVVVLALYWGLRGRRAQNLVLLLASAVFYGWIHPWFLALLYGSSTLDYFCARGMVARPARKRLFLVCSLVGNLGLLGTFKYLDFFLENVSAAMASLGLGADLPTVGLFLPVGISFYTFQTMGYSLDVYRGQLRPRRDYLDYVVFVSFFPQLVAGPVERAPRLLPQVEQARRVTLDGVLSGVSLAAWGAFKKVCIADQVAPYVDRIFGHPDPSGPMIWAATLGFTLQILADFSGYTDMARGTARLLGFELMENFRHPYLAASPSELWQRWHVSFSSWIRDYLYIPLGGSRGGTLSTLKATYGAMLLSGLWHGAAWTYVIWGGYHATLLVLYRSGRRLLPVSLRDRAGLRPLAVMLMFGFTVVGWLAFRETSLSRLVHDLSLPLFGGTYEQWVVAGTMLTVTVVLSLPLVGALLLERFLPRLAASPWRLPAHTLTWGLLGLAVFIYDRDALNDFIYFQF